MALSNPDYSQPSEVGATGVLRSISAIPNPESMFGVQALGRFFAADPFIDSEKHSRNSLRLAGNYSLMRNLELFSGFSFVFNEHSNADQSRSSTSFLENTDLGLRYSLPIFEDCCFVGVAAFARLFSGAQSLRNTSGFSDATSGPLVSGKLLFLTSLDMKKYWPKVPARFHMNFGYRAPNSDITSSQSSVADRQTDIEIFNNDAYKYHALEAHLGAEVPMRWLTPFMEYSIEYALFPSDSASMSSNRQQFGVGTRINPHQAFAIIGGAEFGIDGKNAGKGIGIPENPSWEAFFGVSFQTEGTRLIGSEGSVRGRVLDSETGIPLPDVQAILVAEVTLPQITDLSGFYNLSQLKNGKYQIRFEREGYASQTQSFEVSEGSNVILDIALETLGPKKGGVEATITNSVTGEPIARAFVQISGISRPLTTDQNGIVKADGIQEGMHNIRIEAPGFEPADFPVEIFPKENISQSFALVPEAPKIGHCLGTVTNPDGTGLTAVFTIEDGSIQPFGTNPLTGQFNQPLQAGNYEFKVQAENYLPKSVTCEIAPDEDFTVNVVLEKPQEAVVVEDKIVLPEAIFFNFDSAVIQPRSFEVLSQIADILKDAKNYKVLQIEGHTDSSGAEDYNQSLSEKRARSVEQYLIDKGLDASRLKSVGFGESDPIATNVTAEGRTENRRVEFNLVR